MENLNEMTNYELEMMIREYQQEHQAIRFKLIADLDRMFKIEKEYKKALDIINKRLKR